MDEFKQAKLIKIVCSNCCLHGGIIQLELKEPFNILSKMSKNKRSSPNEIRTRVASVKGMCPNH